MIVEAGGMAERDVDEGRVLVEECTQMDVVCHGDAEVEDLQVMQAAVAKQACGRDQKAGEVQWSVDHMSMIFRGKVAETVGEVFRVNVEAG